MSRQTIYVYHLSFFIAALFSCKVALGESIAEKFVPSDFDERNEYHTYSWAEIHRYIHETIGVTNTFVGKKIKVFGKYSPFDNTIVSINRSRRTWFKSFGCTLEICDRMEGINNFQPLQGIGVYEALTLGFNFELYFKRSKNYAAFLSDAEKQCPLDRSCYIWAKGILNYVNADCTYVFGSEKRQIVYLDIDEVRFYPSDNSDALEGFKEGANIGYKVFKFIMID